MGLDTQLDPAWVRLTTMRFGFVAGLYTRLQLSDWVEQEIMMRDRVPGALLDLATSSHLPVAKVESLLTRVDETSHPEQEARIRVGVHLALYRAGRLELSRVLRALCDEACWDEHDAFSRDERAEMFSLDRQLSLIRDGHLQDDEAHVTDALVELAARFPVTDPFARPAQQAP